MKRRDFLKAAAVSSVWVSSRGAVGIVEAASSTKTVWAEETRDTTVFLSDLHLNIDAPYSWQRENLTPLARFLKNTFLRDDVSDVVILGDFLDDWVVTAEEAPNEVRDILESGINAPVVQALQDICVQSPIKVTFVTGNHDQLSYQARYQDVLKGYFPGMNIVSHEPGLGAFALDDVLWAEHGHRYALFNAPDIWSRSEGHLPLGYFISRLAASQSVRTGQRLVFPEVLERVTGASLKTVPPSGEKLVAAVFWTVAAWAGKRPWDRFVMNGLDGWAEDPTLEEISELYAAIYSEWPLRQNIVLPGTALMSEFRLEAAASLLFTMPERIRDRYPFTPKIVIFGHTHSPTLLENLGSTRGTYVNTGTWVDGHEMTWVEVKKTSEDAYHVSLWYFDG